MSDKQALGAILGAGLGFVFGGGLGLLASGGPGVFAGSVGAGMAKGAQLGLLAGSYFTRVKQEPIIGNRLDDLGFTVSEYGRFIPRAYGKDRVGANVIWMENNEYTPTKHVEEQDAGKGGSTSVTTVSYTYSASFAVALCEQIEGDILRIWANTELIYDATGTGDVSTISVSEQLWEDIEIYKGRSDQTVDEDIEAEHPDSPAYRGTTYIKFKDLQLEKFFNTLPDITVEVINRVQSFSVKGIAVGETTNALFRTFDGINWREAANLSSHGGEILDVIHANNLWLALADAGSSENGMWRSRDGVAWTGIDIGNTAVGRDTTITGERDTQLISFAGSNRWYAVTALNSNNDNAQYSDDNGVSWSSVDNSAIAGSVTCSVSDTNGNCYAVGFDDGKVYKSALGAAFAEVGQLDSGGTYKIFYVSGTLYAISAGSATMEAQVSSDLGANWSAARSVSDSYKILDLKAFDGGVVALISDRNAGSPESRAVYTDDDFVTKTTYVIGSGAADCGYLGDSGLFYTMGLESLSAAYYGNDPTLPARALTGLSNGSERIHDVAIRSDFDSFERATGEARLLSQNTDAITDYGKYSRFKSGTIANLILPVEVESYFQKRFSPDTSGDVLSEKMLPFRELLYRVSPTISGTVSNVDSWPVPNSTWVVSSWTDVGSNYYIGVADIGTGRVYGVRTNELLDVPIRGVYLNGRIFIYCPYSYNGGNSFDGVYIVDVSGAVPEPLKRNPKSGSGRRARRVKHIEATLTTAVNPLAMAADPDGSTLWSLDTTDGTDRTLNQIDPTDGSIIQTLTGVPTGTFEQGHFAVTPDHLYLATATDKITQYEYSTGALESVSEITVFSGNKNIYAITGFLVYFTEEGDVDSDSDATGSHGFITTRAATNSQNADLKACLYAELSNADLIDIDTDVDLSAVTDANIVGFTITDIKSVKAALDSLVFKYQLLGRESGYQISILSREAQDVAATIGSEDLRAHEPGQEVPDEYIVEVPRSLSTAKFYEVGYRDINRDYESNTARAETGKEGATDVERVDLGVVMSASEAAEVADVWMVKNLLASRGIYSVATHSEFNYVDVGDLVTIQTGDGDYTIEVLEKEDGKPGLLKLSGVLADTAIYDSNAVSQSTSAGQSSVAVLPDTEVLVLDIPALRSLDDDFGYYYVCYPLGYADNWDGAVIETSVDGSAYTRAGFYDSGAAIAQATDTLSGNMLSTLFDSSETLNVKNIYRDFTSTTEELLRANEANVFAYGAPGRWEIIKAQTVTDESDGTQTLSKFIRGYYGTEHAMSDHAVGDYVIELDTQTLRRVRRDRNNYNVPLYIRAVTVGTVSANAEVTAEAPDALGQKPVAPSGLHVFKDSNGDFIFNWTPRARFDFEWKNGSNVPLDFASESYTVRITASDPLNGTLDSEGLPEAVRNIDVTDDTATYTVAQQIEDYGVEQNTVAAVIFQNNANYGKGYITVIEG